MYVVIPEIASTMNNILVSTVCGVMSPKPTVLRTVIVQYNESNSVRCSTVEKITVLEKVKRIR
jgi:hypothetical protein